MSYTKQNRDYTSLKPLAQKAYRLFIEECAREGIKIFPTEFLRTQERQYYLYCQGRTAPEAIQAGVPESIARQYAKPNVPQVTWTLKSNHAAGMAWDMACTPPQALYDARVLKQAAEVAKRLGITWGGSFGDSPHFEITKDWKAPVLAPKWQKDALASVVKKLKLDENYWTEEKLAQPITIGELMGIMNKALER